MLQYILSLDNLMFYLLAVEVFFLLLAQVRTNHLLKKARKSRSQKKEQIQQIREEVRMGKSEIPVVKFEKQKSEEVPSQKSEKSGSIDQKEMAVLQEMMAEFFG